MLELTTEQFHNIVNEIPKIGADLHSQRLIEHAKNNLKCISKSIKQLSPLQGPKAQSAIIIGAGPSVHKKKSIQQILNSGYKGSIIAIDGSYIACLKAGLIPDYILTLDPHPTRIVRWFGDPNFEEHTKNDDYFARQDLDIEFRKNTIKQNKRHIELINQYGHKTKAIVASSAPQNVVERIKKARCDTYWWNPLVDDPTHPQSVTKKIYEINKLPCMNTGGTVGTAAWVFTNSFLNVSEIAIVGMDLGYYRDTPYQQTQTYYELIEHLGDPSKLHECFVEFEFPLTGEKFYTDPTYFWYRRNFLELLEISGTVIYNCSEGGTLFSKNIKCLYLKDFLSKFI